MILVFLHGPPACGKYTVAKELAALTDWELYHNHIVVDEVLQEHAFGTPGFIAERDRRWRGYFGQFPGPARKNVIFTFNPEASVPQAFIDWLFGELPRRGVALHSIGLTAKEDVIEARLGAEPRRRFRKLTDLALYQRLRAGGDFDSPVIPRTDLWIDTGDVVPAEAARRIMAHLGPA